MIQRISMTLLISAFAIASIFAQQAPENWFNLDAKQDKVQGLSVEKTYKELLKGKTSQTVIVAVIDSGVDAEHEDLKDVMWVNADEIPNNGKDDDNNGYIDDIHGWNFIGGADGKNVHQDNLEITRLYRDLHKKYKDSDPSSLSRKAKKEYNKYSKLKKELEKNRSEAEAQAAQMVGLHQMFTGALKAVKAVVGEDTELNMEVLDDIDISEDEALAQGVVMLKNVFANGATEKDLKELEGAADYYNSQLNYHYNPDFDPRDIVGDNYRNSADRNYGNNDVEGPDAMHGTHVSGIIAASRNNDIGINGVADNVRIMSIRAVPDGDERDKDVANAIRYAVDNGARIINMSFGKKYSFDKKVVDAAVKYAVKKGVLLVHAAGNDGINTDTNIFYPNDRFKNKKRQAKTWVEIGALSWEGGENSVAPFSNYGSDNVDVFSPGVDLYSTVPNDQYKASSGTSMAAPAAAGVAALVMSYYPKLTAKQVKKVLLDSAIDVEYEVLSPKGDRVQFYRLCRTGGVINAYEAIKLARKTKGKRRVKTKTPRA